MMIALLMVFVFITLTDISLILGGIILPFTVYFLVKLKHESNYHFWLTFVSFLIPAVFLLSATVWLWYLLLYLLAVVLHRTLTQNMSQELTLFYVTAALALGTLGGLNIMQWTGAIRPLSDVYMNFRDWYMGQLDMYGEFAVSQMDTGLISQTLDQIFISLPAYITLISFALALYTVLMLRLILKPSLVKLWEYRSFKDWKFPRFILYLFLISFIVSFFTTEGTTFFSTMNNIIIVLEWVLYIHGLSFAYFFFREKRLHAALSVLLLIPLVILKPLTLLIGIFEMIFRLRTIIELKRK
ncbi:hypothetical protein WN59_06510 [Salinicoccus sediminis]|uniref:DUF2232 domain-containing protein n=2 Tax=Salinicoccus sediminis TaxID=1432562 RepID=A0A0M2SLZ3_9STAP|nr:hypothetical protein WN59_06510 [Salinicoccus sediminis]